MLIGGSVKQQFIYPTGLDRQAGRETWFALAAGDSSVAVLLPKE